ncbi:hypothetical protein [Nocardia sp. NPDC004123]
MDNQETAPVYRTHDWHIQAREYARHEARRGRRFAYTAFDPPRTALVVLDMVPFHVTHPYECKKLEWLPNQLGCNEFDDGGRWLHIRCAPEV